MHEIVTRRYVKKPDAVEAIQLTSGNVNFVGNWCGGKVVRGYDLNDPSRKYLGLNVPAIDGRTVRAHIGDYIVRELSGRFTKLTNEQFIAEYQPESALHRLRDLEAKHVHEMQTRRSTFNSKVG